MNTPRAPFLAALLTSAPALGQVWEIPVGTPEPPVSAEDGIVTFRVGGRSPIELRVPERFVTELPDGWSADGPLTLDTPAGPLTIAEAEVLFERGDDGGIPRLRGKAEVPPPFVSERVTIASPAMAEIGLDLGANLGHLGVPLKKDEHFLFFQFEAGLAVELRTGEDPDSTPPITMSVPAGDGILILNPRDHFYFLGGAFLPDEDDGKKEDEGDDESGADDDWFLKTGNGRSQQSWIPFEPRGYDGPELLDGSLQGFYGNRVTQGVVPIFNLPLEMTGSVVSKVDYASGDEDAIDPLGLGFGPKVRAGGNGELAVAFPIAKVAGLQMDFGFSLGDASAYVEVLGDHQQAWFRGTVDPDDSWLPRLPLRPSVGVEVSAFLSNAWETSTLEAHGHYGLDASYFGELVGIPMGDLLRTEGRFRVDRTGVVFAGETGSQLGPFVPRGTLGVEARFFARRSDLLALTGDFDVAGLATSGELRFEGGAATLNGKLVVGHWILDVTGKLVDDGAHGLTLVGEYQVPSNFGIELAHRVRSKVDTAQAQADAHLAELEAATRAYEFEASLRGVRSALPGICDAAIRAIDKDVPAQVKSNWPEKFGRRLPGLKTGTKRAVAQARPWRDRFSHLKSLAREADDASLRAGLKSALKDVIAKRKMKIKIPVAGTVYSGDVISSGTVKKLQAAIAGIDALPAASDKRISAQKVWEAARPRAELRRMADSLDTPEGPCVERITFRWPLSITSTRRPVQVTVREGARRRVLDLECDLKNPAAMRDAILADIMAGL